MGIVKTNAIRQIEAKKYTHTLYEYDVPEGFVDGVSAAGRIGKPVEMVYKTLVTQGSSKEYFVCVIPVDRELDLKMAAKAFGEKKLELIPAKEITLVTGYIKGGCSPVGMKKLFKTAVDQHAESLQTIVVSGGRVGLQVELEVSALLDITRGKLEKLTGNETSE